jgi:hypothetical protein
MAHSGSTRKVVMSSFGPFSVGKAVLDWMSAFLSKCGGSWKRMLALLIDHRFLVGWKRQRGAVGAVTLLLALLAVLLYFVGLVTCAPVGGRCQR